MDDFDKLCRFSEILRAVISSCRRCSSEKVRFSLEEYCRGALLLALFVDTRVTTISHRGYARRPIKNVQADQLHITHPAFPVLPAFMHIYVYLSERSVFCPLSDSLFLFLPLSFPLSSFFLAPSLFFRYATPLASSPTCSLSAVGGRFSSALSSVHTCQRACERANEQLKEGKRDRTCTHSRLYSLALARTDTYATRARAYTLPRGRVFGFFYFALWR